jgi:hypothetical protein
MGNVSGGATNATWLAPPGTTTAYNPHTSLFNDEDAFSSHVRHHGHSRARGHKKAHHKKPHHPGHLRFKLPHKIEDQPF